MLPAGTTLVPTPLLSLSGRVGRLLSVLSGPWRKTLTNNQLTESLVRSSPDYSDRDGLPTNGHQFTDYNSGRSRHPNSFRFRRRVSSSTSTRVETSYRSGVTCSSTGSPGPSSHLYSPDYGHGDQGHDSRPNQDVEEPTHRENLKSKRTDGLPPLLVRHRPTPIPSKVF